MTAAVGSGFNFPLNLLDIVYHSQREQCVPCAPISHEIFPKCKITSALHVHMATFEVKSSATQMSATRNSTAIRILANKCKNNGREHNYFVLKPLFRVGCHFAGPAQHP